MGMKSGTSDLVPLGEAGVGGASVFDLVLDCTPWLERLDGASSESTRVKTTRKRNLAFMVDRSTLACPWCVNARLEPNLRTLRRNVWLE